MSQERTAPHSFKKAVFNNGLGFSYNAGIKNACTVVRYRTATVDVI